MRRSRDTHSWSSPAPAGQQPALRQGIDLSLPRDGSATLAWGRQNESNYVLMHARLR